MRVIIRNTHIYDIPEIKALCERAGRRPSDWAEDRLRAYLEFFPEGQFVAVDRSSGTILGAAASLVVAQDGAGVAEALRNLGSDQFVPTHDRVLGRTLYGAEILLDPACSDSSIDMTLYACLRALVRWTGLRELCTLVSLDGAVPSEGKLSLGDYLQEVEHGKLIHPVLSPRLKDGDRVLGFVPSTAQAVLGWIPPIS